MVCSICKKPGHNRVTCKEKECSDAKVEVKRQGLRSSSVALSACEVWTYRNDVDSYTRRSKLYIVDNIPEVDHVFEIQLLDSVYSAYLESEGRIGKPSVAEHSRLIYLANSLKNLNVTSQAVNRSKKGPFTRAKNELIKNDFQSNKCKGIDTYVFNKDGERHKKRYAGFTTQEWYNIKHEVVESYENISNSIPEAIYNQRNGELFQDFLHEIFASMKLED